MASRIEPNELMQVDKIRRACRLRAEGKTIPTIANELKTTTKAVAMMLVEGLRAVQSESIVEAGILREDISARLEWAMECLAPEVQLGKPFAIEKWISGHMAIAKLHGLDNPVSPAQVTVNINQNKTEQLDTGVARALSILQRAADRLEQLGIAGNSDVVDGQVRELVDIPNRLNGPPPMPNAGIERSTLDR